MSWSLRRRLIIIGIIAIFVLLVMGGTAYLFEHKAPTCTDGKQNQDEEGVDCGGSCPYLCTVSQAEPSVRFVRTISPLPGRTDVIAYIDNPNSTSAARGAQYKIELYDDRNVSIAKGDGVVDLPAGGTVPVFVPNFFSGSETVAHAFLTIASSSLQWYKATPTPSPVTIKDVILSQPEPPRITATIGNPTATAIRNTHLIVTVFDADGNAIASSQTIAPEIPPQGTTQVVFTWPAAFTGTISRIEVVPVVTLTP